jgi:hypothetical protein
MQEFWAQYTIRRFQIQCVYSPFAAQKHYFNGSAFDNRRNLRKIEAQSDSGLLCWYPYSQEVR